MKFVSHTPQNCYLVIWGGVEGEGEGGATLLYYRGSTSSMCHFFNPHGLFATLDMYSVWTEKVYSQDVYQYVSLEGHLDIFWGKTLPQLLKKWYPLQGEQAHSQTPISIQIKSKSNPIHCLLFFLPLSPGPT